MTDARRIETLPVSDLIPYARNSRTHSEQQVAQIAASIREFGFTNPVLIDDDQGIIAGHGRVQAARVLGLESVPCLRLSHLTEAQRRAYVIADNRLALNAGWDFDMLAVELDDLRDVDFDIDLLGFSREELNEMVGTPNEPPENEKDADAVPTALARAVTVRGDVWSLGEHRIICGDCRIGADVRTLTQDREINLAFTSPPYAEQRTYDQASGFIPIPPDDYVRWFEDVAANVKSVLAADGSWFVNIKPPAEGLDTDLYVFDLVIAHVRQWGWHFATEYCWERSGMPKSVTRRFKNQFEPVYQFALGDWKMRPDAVRHESDKVPVARGKGAGTTTLGKAQKGGVQNAKMQGAVGFKWFKDQYAPDGGMAYPGNRLPSFAGSHTAVGHSAAFPVGLPEWFMKAYTDEGDSVFDPFMGSGSTLIAAEKSGRVAFGTELSPIYCDVIVRRWQEFTGKRATLVGDGRSFDEVSASREEKVPA